MSPAANSTRWCPTPEQLMMLEEMYRAGIRTPNASQIQHITGQLSFYGKIEGKNVFYWFQNHKARDRQNLRRKLCKQLQQQQLFYHHQHHKDYHNNYHNYPYYQKSLLGCLDQTSTCHHYNNFSSASSFLPPQVAGVEDTLMNYSAWKMEMPADQRVEMEKSEMSTYGRDWMMMMMMDVGPPFSSCGTSTTRSTSTRPPIKTLQLFPITPPNKLLFTPNLPKNSN